MRRWLLVLIFGASVGAWAQSSSNPSSSAPPNSPDSSNSQETANSQERGDHTPNLAPPRSDKVDADALDEGESSSKDTQIDLSPPPDDAKHPGSSEILMDEASASGSGDVREFHPWDPHKAAKDVEVGDFYFKRKNYRAAEDRYREALLYKENDAIATFRLAVCLEKLDQSEDAREEYQSYLKILPQGPEAGNARKAIDRLTRPAASAKPAK